MSTKKHPTPLERAQSMFPSVWHDTGEQRQRLEAATANRIRGLEVRPKLTVPAWYVNPPAPAALRPLTPEEQIEVDLAASQRYLEETGGVETEDDAYNSYEESELSGTQAADAASGVEVPAEIAEQAAALRAQAQAEQQAGYGW